MFEIEYYSTEGGYEPARDFLDTIKDVKVKEKVVRGLMLLEEMGNRLQEPDSKYLKEGIFELRASFAKNSIRVFYFFVRGQKIIVTNGYTKKTRKAPSRQIKAAIAYKKDYLSRNAQPCEGESI